MLNNILIFINEITDAAIYFFCRNDKMISFFQYIGGKVSMTKEIIRLLDYNRKCYLELFGGSAKVLLNKQNHEIEIYNDKDENIVNLFEVVKNKTDEFVKWFDLKLYSKRLYKNYLQELKTTGLQGTDVERAGKYFYILQISFVGKIGGFGLGYIRDHTGVFYNKIKNIKIIYERIKKVQFINDNYDNVINNIIRKNPDIMIYADPPYWNAEHYYQSKFTREDHFKLAEMLNKVDASVMVSYYYFPELEEMYPKDKWHYIKFEKAKRATTINRNQNVEELLILNYDIYKSKLGF